MWLRAPACVGRGRARLRRTIPATKSASCGRTPFLALVFITNEDDCSAPPDTPLFTSPAHDVCQAPSALSAPSVATSSDTCAAARCRRVPGREHVRHRWPTAARTKAACSTRCTALANFFKSLKTDPAMLFVSAIAGPVTPYTIDFRPARQRQRERRPSSRTPARAPTAPLAIPRCAWPSSSSQFGSNGSFSSICDDSYAPALTQLGTAIGRAFTSHCLDAAGPGRAIRRRRESRRPATSSCGRPAAPIGRCPPVIAATPQGGPNPAGT